MIRVKVCGLTRPQDAALAAEAGAWAVGLVFCRRSPRFINAAQARAICAVLPKTVLRVGVFMDQSLETVRKVAADIPLDLIQLHGAEPDSFCLALGEKRCIKAFVLRSAGDAERAESCPAEYLLADRSRSEPEAPGPAQWMMAGALAEKRRTLLAGGLTPDNVAEAVAAAKPWGVDVSGGLEAAPGIKDPDRVRVFFAALRRTEAG
ncbi:MAG: phosphoribosylanthranilate isomerase [Elusimicrobia bacterium]|nr:phosphoribosylanthranilate isomerase [Elusimicrobiota bacterium]